MKTKKQIEYHGGRIKRLVETVADMIRKNPNMDNAYLHATLSTMFNGYGKMSHCFNCGRSMKITLYVADLFDALLIMAMAKVVRENMDKGMNFTEANKVHVPSLQTTNAIIKRQTKCDYLGLIKQPEELRGTGYWVLTNWAWKALKGMDIPKAVKYWEGKLIGRSEERTNLAQMFRTHRELVERAIAKRKQVRSDYRKEIVEYEQSEWSSFGGYIQEEDVVGC